MPSNVSFIANKAICREFALQELEGVFREV
jgi:hypothetical protein